MIEHVLRAVIIVVLAVMLWQSLHKQPAAADDAIRASTLDALAAWSTAPVAPRRIHVELDSAPAPLERDWLKAVAAAGSEVSWSGNLPPLMISVQPVASPNGGLKVRIAAPAGSSVELDDEVGVVDTMRAQNAGASLGIRSAAGQLTALVNRSKARTSLRDSVELHKVLVIGNAGWESKFVIAALEEDGWKVDAFVRVAPGIDVTQGSTAAIDTSRYSAVVALDDAAAPYAGRIAAFVRSGGGLVLAPTAAALDALAPLRSGDFGRTIPAATTIERSSSVSLATLAFDPLTGLRNDAVPLERRTSSVAVAARRIGAGRALQSGYEDTWRWRMSGGDNSVRDHRDWWTGLVSDVAYAPRLALRPSVSHADDAPLTDLVRAIGPRSEPASIANAGLNPSHWMAWLFVLLSLALMGEVASRRLRGAR